ncbi:MAG: GNAT family protein [Erysipelotrichaceae bacterium]|nr:GNAT family protein [Erysipelotrichaceae bacterium]
MKKLSKKLFSRNIILRLVQKEDKSSYYNAGFRSIDSQSMYFTQTSASFSEDQIYGYIDRIVDDENRYDFLITDSSGVIFGESVLNEIDWQKRIANYRIVLFNQKYFGRGIGSEALSLTVSFGFEELGLLRIELEVFGFNERAIRAYKKVGFVTDEIEENVKLLDGSLGSIYKMSIEKSQFQQ